MCAKQYSIIYQSSLSMTGQWLIIPEKFPSENAAIDWAIKQSNKDVAVWHVAVIDDCW